MRVTANDISQVSPNKQKNQLYLVILLGNS